MAIVVGPPAWPGATNQVSPPAMAAPATAAASTTRPAPLRRARPGLSGPPESATCCAEVALTAVNAGRAQPVAIASRPTGLVPSAGVAGAPAGGVGRGGPAGPPGRGGAGSGGRTGVQGGAAG